MATFHLTIDTDNAAFEDDPDELASILTSLARYATRDAIAGADAGHVGDSNGNTCGSWSFTADES